METQKVNVNRENVAVTNFLWRKLISVPQTNIPQKSSHTFRIFIGHSVCLSLCVFVEELSPALPAGDAVASYNQCVNVCVNDWMQCEMLGVLWTW